MNNSKMDNNMAIQVTIELGSCSNEEGCDWTVKSGKYRGLITEVVIAKDGDGGVSAVRDMAQKVLEWAVNCEKQ